MNVIVIGGGASGLMAAITAAKSAYDALSDCLLYTSDAADD